MFSSKEKDDKKVDKNADDKKLPNAKDLPTAKELDDKKSKQQDSKDLSKDLKDSKDSKDSKECDPKEVAKEVPNVKDQGSVVVPNAKDDAAPKHFLSKEDEKALACDEKSKAEAAKVQGCEDDKLHQVQGKQGDPLKDGTKSSCDSVDHLGASHEEVHGLDPKNLPSPEKELREEQIQKEKDALKNAQNK